MLEYGIDRTRDLIRRSLRDAQAAKISGEKEIINDAIQYFDRQADHSILKQSMKSRFARGITKVGGIGGELEGGYETYTKGALGEQIDQGLVENVTSGIGSKITTALANLFTESTQYWQYLSQDGDVNDDVSELISRHRLAGGFDTAVINCDSLSCGINNGFLLIDWIGGHLKYRVVSPTAVHAMYHATVTDNGVERGVDYSEIEDATVIVIRLADTVAAAPDQRQYMAIFGRSDVYEHGRMVTYRSTKWDDIPDENMGGVDYRLDNGQIANPLSWLAAQHLDRPIPEYPLVKFYGGLSRIDDKLITTTTSLYENVTEIDMAYCQLLKDALTGALGVTTIKNPQSNPLPRAISGAVALLDGQELDIVGRPAINSKFALDVLEGIVVAVGGGYSVPDYFLVSDNASLSASSGVALMIRTKPLISFRDYRIGLNRRSVERIWLIESGLIEAHTEDDLSGVIQVWHPGDIKAPEDKTERLNRLILALDKGAMDYVDFVREYNDLPNRAAAEVMIEEMQESATAYPAPQQQQQKQRGSAPVGITRGF